MRGGPSGIDDDGVQVCTGSWYYVSCEMPNGAPVGNVLLRIAATNGVFTRLAASWQGGAASVVLRARVDNDTYDAALGLPVDAIVNNSTLEWDLPMLGFPRATSAVMLIVTSVEPLANGAESAALTGISGLAASDGAPTAVAGAWSDCEPACGAGPSVQRRVVQCVNRLDGVQRALTDCDNVVDTMACSVDICPLRPIIILQPRANVIVTTNSTTTIVWSGGRAYNGSIRLQVCSCCFCFFFFFLHFFSYFSMCQIVPVRRALNFVPSIRGAVIDLSPASLLASDGLFHWHVDSTLVDRGLYVVRITDTLANRSFHGPIFVVEHEQVEYEVEWLPSTSLPWSAPASFNVTIVGTARNSTTMTVVAQQTSPPWFGAAIRSDSLSELRAIVTGSDTRSWSMARVRGSDGAVAEFGSATTLGGTDVVQLDCLGRYTCGDCVVQPGCAYCATKGLCRAIALAALERTPWCANDEVAVATSLGACRLAVEHSLIARPLPPLADTNNVTIIDLGIVAPPPPPPPLPSPSPPPSLSDGSLTLTQIITIACSACGVLIIIVVVTSTYCCWLRRRRRRFDDGIINRDANQMGAAATSAGDGDGAAAVQMHSFRNIEGGSARVSSEYSSTLVSPPTTIMSVSERANYGNSGVPSNGDYGHVSPNPLQYVSRLCLFLYM